jgi:hypothetical protein
VMPSRYPISFVVRPRASQPSTSASRSVRSAGSGGMAGG